MFPFRKPPQDPIGGLALEVRTSPLNRGGALGAEPAAALPRRVPADLDPRPGAAPLPAPASQGVATEAGADRTAEELLGDARRMNLVGGNDLAASVEEAVRRALARHLPDVSPAIGGDIARSTRGALFSLLKTRSKKVRGLPKAHFLKEVEASKRKIVAEREAARRELESLLEGLGKKRVEFRAEQENLVRQTFDKGLVQDQELSEIIYQALGGADATPEMRAVQKRVTALVLDSLQRERQKGVEETTSGHDEELRRYELRIAKLTKSLELTEEELKRIAAMKGIDPGVASIYRTIQGLDAGDDNAESKREMLAGIFQANLALQQQVANKAG